MSDLRDPLDREAATIRADADALGAVRRRVARHRRFRRGVAGAIAIAIGAAGISLAYTAFVPDRSQRPASQAGTTPTDLPIWPDGTAAELDQIQQSVADGHQPWHLSPQLVAQVFAMEVMHWEREDVRVEAADPDTSGFAVASISNPALASEAETPTVTTVLEMERWRGRPDGIFVITKATSDAISIERPLQYEDFGPAPVFEGNLAMVPDGVLAIGAWKHDLSRIYAFAPPKEHFKFDLADRRRPESGPVHEDWPWGSHSIASVRLIHAPGFLPLSNGEAEEPWGPDGPVLAMSAYRLGQYLPDPESPTGGETPVPGPTPTGDDETPAPVKIVIEDRTGANKTLNYAYAWIEARGRGTDHGGYDVGEAYNSGFEGSQETSVAPTLTGDPIPITTIYCEPQYDAEAARMQRLLFPGARISREPPDDGVNVDYGDHQPALRVELGQDFAERHRQAMDAYWFLGDFGLAREVESPRAYSFVTEEAARAYREGPELSMYEYAAGRPFDVGVTQNGGVPVDGEPGVELSLTYYGDTEADFHSELVRVSIVDGELRVVEASLVASGSS